MDLILRSPVKLQEGGQGEIFDNFGNMLSADHSFILGIVKNLRHDPGYALSKAVSLRKIKSTPKIMKIAALAIAMTIFTLPPFVAALGHKNSRHREERSDLQLFVLPNT